MQKKNEEVQDSLNKVVFYCSATLILLFSIITILFNEQANLVIINILNWVSSTFSWYYLLAATLYLVFIVFIACSRYGEIKLGPKHSKPEFSLLSWSAMLFSAGIGIDLMFFSVAEPLSHYMSPPVGEAETFEAARQSMVWTLFHYGLTGWSMYALIGVALGYFSYRYNLPLTIRSALYPIFGKRINGPFGHRYCQHLRDRCGSAKLRSACPGWLAVNYLDSICINWCCSHYYYYFRHCGCQ